MSNKVYEGRVYFKSGEGTHLQEFSSHKDEPIKDDKKVRIAYMVVSTKEVNELAKGEADKEKILKKVKDKYALYLKEAIEKESKVNDNPITLFDLQHTNDILTENKLVKLVPAKLYGSKSYGSVLKAKGYTLAHKELENSLKTNDSPKSTALLTFTRDSSAKLLQEEMQKINQKSEEKPQPSLILSMPYVYNTVKKSHKKELEVTMYEEKTTISFMPETVVEYGVFFDGTKNNMYNIDFYRNFTEFLHESSYAVELNRDEAIKKARQGLLATKPKVEKGTTIQDYILSTPTPQKSPEVILLIISQIDARKNIRYFDKESNLDENDKQQLKTVLKSVKADHAGKVFDYLLDIKNSATKAPQTEEEKRAAKIANAEKCAEYVQKKILPQNGDSSYTNGKTNIERLYHLYDGEDVKNDKNSLSVTRFKLYESGSGTHNPYVEEEYESDNTLFGLGTGTDDTGVIAHIIYSCEKLADQLRVEKITHVDELVLDVFGFSRGSASARHFICSILKHTEVASKGNREYTITLKGIEDIFEPFYGENGSVVFGGKRFFNPLRTDIQEYHSGKIRKRNPFYQEAPIVIDSLSFRFVGIYDTVTHYGIFQDNDYKDLNIDFFANAGDKKIGQLVHLMADDEYRFNFDAYSIFSAEKVKHKITVEDKKKGIIHFEEIIFPGAHADVGGGYNKEGETVQIGTTSVRSSKLSVRLKSKIEAWNNKYHWMQTSNVVQKDSFNDIKNAKEDGFYCVIVEAHQPYKDFITYIPPVHMAFIYMHKTEVSNTYEHVSLKLMHNRAVYKNVYNSVEKGSEKEGAERVPFGSITPEYDFKDDKFLNNVYKELANNKELKTTNLEFYKKLKNSYLHHSSNWADWIVNRPSSEDEDKGDFYGKRVLYTSTGTKYTRSWE